jgi:hypothetical protein
MKKTALLVALLAVLTASCGDDSVVFVPDNKAAVVINDIPYRTDRYYRIPYTLRLWEYEKDGLALERIEVIDAASREVLLTIAKADLPTIFKDPLTVNPYFSQDKISGCYLSLQLPLSAEQRKPTRIIHRFTFSDAERGRTVRFTGAPFIPRLGESPRIIASPLKDSNLVFINQSTMGYHFYVLFFVDGNLFRGERFAFDSLQLNDDYSEMLSGDPKVNASYFNYRDTLYAVADGVVVRIRDGRPENNGDAHDAPPTALDELGGNYLVLDIGGGHYAYYAHCVPNSFMVKEGDVVKEGQALALLGNSGNSDAPHLHFEITDGTDILFSNGVPFVLKEYVKLGDMVSGPGIPATVTNAMMEESTVIGFR